MSDHEKGTSFMVRLHDLWCKLTLSVLLDLSKLHNLKTVRFRRLYVTKEIAKWSTLKNETRVIVVLFGNYLDFSDAFWVGPWHVHCGCVKIAKMGEWLLCVNAYFVANLNKIQQSFYITPWPRLSCLVLNNIKHNMYMLCTMCI